MGSYSPAPPPEILPPATSQQAQPSRRRSRWAVAPATYVLIAINCLWFLYMSARGVSFMDPTGEQLMHFGADNAGSVLIYGEWYRIFTAMFVHAGILHLSVNMWCLWNLGLLAEPLMGSTGVFAVYLLTGTAGNLLSNLVNWYRFHAQGQFPACVGASGAVFGIAGALIILLKSQRLPVPPSDLHKLRRSVIYFAAINLAIGFAISFTSGLTGIDIDNMAHLGGVSCGLLFAMPMVPRLGSPRSDFQSRLRLAIGIVVGILILFTFYIHKAVPVP
ncbi:MAG TPA: rhomboid family intramembrane serine protease [Terracidiphilus sp.]|nr:rhomboid family intramembrane serine protease [Terracidiphilus sp.]